MRRSTNLKGLLEHFQEMPACQSPDKRSALWGAVDPEGAKVCPGYENRQPFGEPYGKPQGGHQTGIDKVKMLKHPEEKPA